MSANLYLCAGRSLNAEYSAGGIYIAVGSDCMLDLPAPSIIRSHECVKVCHTYYKARETSVGMPQRVTHAFIRPSEGDLAVDYLLKTRLRLQSLITAHLKLLILAAVLKNLDLSRPPCD